MNWREQFTKRAQVWVSQQKGGKQFDALQIAALRSGGWTEDEINLAVDASGIEDGSITISKIADGTAGELITWDVLGAATTVSTGTSGQFLISNGAGAEPTFQDLGSGSSNVLPRGFIDGLTLSRASGDPDHDIEIAIGKSRDSTDAEDINLSSAFIKQLDASWVAGTGVGGFPTGISLSPDTWYHVFVIRDTTNNLTDAGFDTDLSATNLLADATDYSLFRRLGSVLTDGSSNMLNFFQHGDLFLWAARSQDFSTSISTSASLQTISTPLGVRVEAQINYTNAGAADVYVSPPDVDDEAASQSQPRGTTPVNQPIIDWVLTNTSSQLRFVTSSTTNVECTTFGWRDSRGKDS